MALFTINRYMGEDEDLDNTVSSPDIILSNLHKRAEQRKLQIKKGKDDILVSNAIEDDKGPSPQEEKKRRKKKHESPSHEGDERTPIVKTPKVKKKKRKIDSECGDTEIAESESHNVEQEKKQVTEDDNHLSENVPAPKKKKKGKQALSTEISVNTDSRDEIVTKKKIKNKKIKKESTDFTRVKDEIVNETRTDDDDVPSKDKAKGKKRTSSMENDDDDDDDDDEEDGSQSGEEKDADENEDDDVERQEDEGKKEEVAEKDNELGFTILGDIENQKAKKVHRVLPDWLANPSIIANDISLETCKIQDLPGLHEKILTKLEESGITHFFPVQQQVIPAILSCVRHGLQAGVGGFRPSDMCVSAPTGSGKTLAFVIPVIQALMNRIVCQARALAVLPTRDLAMQVYQVFTKISKGTGLKIALTAGHKTLAQEQALLVKEGDCGHMSLADIVVATPGRLVDHINKTPGFTLQYLRFLIIDEADRMIDQLSKDWIQEVEKAAYRSVDGCPVRQQHTSLTVANAYKIQLPLQKLLFSATLSQNPEKLMPLNLFHPRLFTSVVKGAGDAESVGKEWEFVGKYTTPAGLTEHLIQCLAGEKPLMVLHLLEKFQLSQVLCFTNTVEATHRLHMLLKLCGGITVAEFSAKLTSPQRTRLLKQFKDGEIQILICSDAMARGMDITEANAVICYDVPPYIKTYIHRVGRTARAGRQGTAYTLVLDKQRKRFESMLKDAGKVNAQWMKIKRKMLEPFVEAYEGALQQLPDVLQENEKGKK